MTDYTEGQTATNKATGEKVVFSNGAWEPYGGEETPFPQRDEDVPEVQEAPPMKEPVSDTQRFLNQVNPLDTSNWPGSGPMDSASALGGGLGVQSYLAANAEVSIGSAAKAARIATAKRASDLAKTVPEELIGAHTRIGSPKLLAKQALTSKIRALKARSAAENLESARDVGLAAGGFGVIMDRLSEWLD